jgi:hypothetical protein
VTFLRPLSRWPWWADDINRGNDDMSDRIAVRLLSYYGGVNKGEIAGYVPEVAERLIAEGRAEAYVPEAEGGTGEDAPDAKAAKGGKAAAPTLPVQGADA